MKGINLNTNKREFWITVPEKVKIDIAVPKNTVINRVDAWWKYGHVAIVVRK